MNTLLAGVSSRRIPTSRLTVNLLELRGRSGIPVLFVHGNVSSSLFWQPMMLALPEKYRPIAVDLRGFGDTDPAPVDATRGVRDFADDIAATVGALELPPAHVVGWSLGGGVVLQYLLDAPQRIASLTLVDPVSPLGFGGTRGAHGALCDPSGAGSGGGCVNHDFVARLAAGDRSDDSLLSPRQVMLAHYVKPPHVPEHVDVFVESMLSTRIGDDNYPGTSSAVQAWPGMAPGDRGVLNSIAPTHFRIDDLSGVDPKPPIRWIRGADDVIVSDTSLYDIAFLGSLGVVPGWPGAEQWPPQPMLAQTRSVLDGYAAAGGTYSESNHRRLRTWTAPGSPRRIPRRAAGDAGIGGLIGAGCAGRADDLNSPRAHASTLAEAGRSGCHDSRAGCRDSAPVLCTARQHVRALSAESPR